MDSSQRSRVLNLKRRSNREPSMKAPSRCMYCGFHYARLQKHIKQSHKISNVCIKCTIEFSEYAALQQHLDRVHRLEDVVSQLVVVSDAVSAASPPVTATPTVTTTPTTAPTSDNVSLDIEELAFLHSILSQSSIGSFSGISPVRNK